MFNKVVHKKTTMTTLNGNGELWNGGAVDAAGGRCYQWHYGA